MQTAANETALPLKSLPERFILKPGRKRALIINWSAPLPNKPYIIRYYAKDFSEKALQHITQKGRNGSVLLQIETLAASELIVQPNHATFVKPKVTENDQQALIQNAGHRLVKIMVTERHCRTQNNCKKTGFTSYLYPQAHLKLTRKPNSAYTIKYWHDNAGKWSKLATYPITA